LGRRRRKGKNEGRVVMVKVTERTKRRKCQLEGRSI
jgi:hypothetical protein